MTIKAIINTLFFTLFSIAVFSQTVTYQQREYEVKGERILLDGDEVTEELSFETKNALYKLALDKRTNKKKYKKEEKEAKKKEKELKKRERELEKKENAQEDYDDAVEKLDKAQAKYEKLKRKGKLSPNDEVKWLDKIAKLQEKVAKKKKKLK